MLAALHLLSAKVSISSLPPKNEMPVHDTIALFFRYTMLCQDDCLSMYKDGARYICVLYCPQFNSKAFRWVQKYGRCESQGQVICQRVAAVRADNA